MLEWSAEYVTESTTELSDLEFLPTSTNVERGVRNLEFVLQQMQTAHMGLTRYEVNDIVANSRKNPLKAWQRLHKRFDPTTGGRNGNLLRTIVSPGRCSLLEDPRGKVGRDRRKDDRIFAHTGHLVFAASEQLNSNVEAKRLWKTTIRCHIFTRVCCFQSPNSSTTSQNTLAHRQRDLNVAEMESLCQPPPGQFANNAGEDFTQRTGHVKSSVPIFKNENKKKRVQEQPPQNTSSAKRKETPP